MALVLARLVPLLIAASVSLGCASSRSTTSAARSRAPSFPAGGELPFERVLVAQSEQLEVRILGPLEVLSGGEPVAAGGPKQREVLAVLATRAGISVSTDALIEALWPETPPPTAQTTLQGYVSRLRKLLGADAIVTDAGGYRLALDGDMLDTARFERLTETAGMSRTAGRVDDAEAALVEALSLWRGPALVDFAYEPWAQPEITRLEERRLTCVEERFELDLALGRHAELVAELQRVAQEHPLRERLRGQLMVALYRSGRQADALAAFQDVRSTLVEELGIEPGPELQALHVQILNQDEALSAPHQLGPAPARHEAELPSPPSPLIGRVRELSELHDLLRSQRTRIITLTGPGGTGKTRLALQAAEQARGLFGNDVYWVGLSALRDAALVSETIGRALGVSGELEDALAERHALLVLDNFEQVIDAAPELSALASRCPRITLLVTSRELLRIGGEVEYPVAPLTEQDAVALFCERSRLDADRAIAELCSRLDNLPLAVTLAAARTKALSPGQILERLAGHLDMLKGARDSEPRQQTLRATIEWSLHLLGDDERRLFEDLSVFSGGCVLDAAERVCGAELDTLQSLVEKSLVRHGDERYWMLETIREYALELRHAGERDDKLARRHAEHFVSLAQAAAPHLHEPEHAHLLDELERELPNVRAALSWLLERDIALALDLAGALWEFWWIRGHVSEGRRWLDAAIAAAPDADQRARYTALSGAGILARTQGDTAALQRSLERALELAREIGDAQLLADALNYLGGAYIGWLDDLERAQQVLQESLVLRREIGDDVGVMKILGNLGIVAEKQGELEVARLSYGEALALARELGSTMGQSIGLNHLALLLLDTDPGEARAMFSESLGIARSAHDMDLAWYALQGLAAADAAGGDATTAAVLLGAIDASLEQIGYALDDDEQERIEQATARARESLGESAFAETFARGRELSLDEAVDHGLGATEPH